MQKVQCPFTSFTIEDWVEVSIEQITASHAQHFIECTEQAGMPSGKSKTIKTIAFVFDHMCCSFVPCLRGRDQIGTIEQQAGIKISRKLHQPLVSLIRAICEATQLQHAWHKVGQLGCTHKFI